MTPFAASARANESAVPGTARGLAGHRGDLLLKGALIAALAVGATVLAGCSSNHPVTKAGEACASCHSDGRTAVEGAGSAAVTECGLTFAVESGAGEVFLGRASVAEDGTIVPSRERTLAADELGAVTVSSPGLYALATGDVASPSAVVLVHATESGPESTTVKL